MLHNKHVMVRVGGGWETFESYLLKHDPCRMLQFSRVEGKTSPINNSKSPNIKDLTPDSYLVVAAHYRSKKWDPINKLDADVLLFLMCLCNNCIQTVAAVRRAVVAGHLCSSDDKT